MKRWRDKFNELFSKAGRDARKDSKAFLEKKSTKQKSELNKINNQTISDITYGLRLAKNTSNQEIEILEKKEFLAKQLLKNIDKFWKKSEDRHKEILKFVNKVKKKNPNINIYELSEEEKLIFNEESTLKHLKKDAYRINETLKKKRDNDLLPLLAKANHISKMIIYEENKGAVNPRLLKEFQIYEDHILKKINYKEVNSYQLDEFKTIKRIIQNLKHEINVLIQEKDRTRNKKEKKRIKKRVNIALAQQLILKNILHLADINNMKHSHLRKNALEIYNVLKLIHNVETKEEQILEKN
jgi:hypothetical protein